MRRKKRGLFDEFDEGDVSSTLIGMSPISVDETVTRPDAEVVSTQAEDIEQRGAFSTPMRERARVKQIQTSISSATLPKLKAVRRPRKQGELPFLPQSPRSVESTGLNYSYLEDLCLKHLFQGGELRGAEMAERICLPSVIIEEILQRLRKNKFVDIKGGGTGLGYSRMVYSLTESGHTNCLMSMERDRYTGPAPIPYKYYLQAVGAQSIRGNRLRKNDLVSHFTDLVLSDDVYDAIGPAMNSGKALFFYGPPGNGKTAICERMTKCFGEDVFIPYAIIVDDFIIKIFDDTIHQRSEAKEDAGLDERWVRCKRPMVIVGGELVLEDLNLAYSSEVKYYESPFQLKANCGMLLIDDFGRQAISPKELLNRWIVPLESEVDFLTMHTGKKLQVPFNLFVVFSTNLDPASLVDAAFLRRVRYKLEVKRPDTRSYKDIFRSECVKQHVKWDSSVVDYLLNKHYGTRNLPLNACEPRDLLAQVVDLCNYRGHEAVMTEEIMDKVVANYFVQFD